MDTATIISLVLATIGVIAAVVVIPEVRKFLRLDKPIKAYVNIISNEPLDTKKLEIIEDEILLLIRKNITRR